MNAKILVVDDERTIGIAIQRLLKARGYDVGNAPSADEAIRTLNAQHHDLIITDLNLGKMSGMDLLRWVRQHTPDTGVIMITAYGSEKIAVEAMKLGAEDYLPKPFDNDELELLVERALDGKRLRRDLKHFQEQASEAFRFENILGKSAAMQRVFEVVRKVADTDLTVLIRGPSGTGKELVANAVHYNSARRGKPLIKVNCAAFARELVESELFGHERGAFTGAVAARQGKFEAADGGSLFLDEIGDMSLETQAKILRVLQEREFERVGGNRTIQVDVRIIAATNQHLEERVKSGAFREDLYYRLRVIQIELPSLCERTEDLPLLIEHFINKSSERMGRGRKSLSADAYRVLLEHSWPGNVRELEHAIEQAVALSSGNEIQTNDLPLAPRLLPPLDPTSTATSTFRDAKQRLIEQFERDFIVAALQRQRGNISKTAEEIGMYRQQLQQKLTEYGIDASAYR